MAQSAQVEELTRNDLRVTEREYPFAGIAGRIIIEVDNIDGLRESELIPVIREFGEKEK